VASHNLVLERIDMSTYRAYQVTGNRQFELVERELHEPSAGHVRFRVESCGVCHSDFIAVEGARPDPSQPVVPGHEVVGVIDAVGDGVIGWKTGDRVGRWLPRRALRSM
jgi:D-arabinose 1-dehydrogenase-like Zn-dependent alcohol dehydrogenase